MGRGRGARGGDHPETGDWFAVIAGTWQFPLTRPGSEDAVSKLAHRTINGCKPLGAPISTNLSASSSALRTGCRRRRRGNQQVALTVVCTGARSVLPGGWHAGTPKTPSTHRMRPLPRRPHSLASRPPTNFRREPLEQRSPRRRGTPGDKAWARCTSFQRRLTAPQIRDSRWTRSATWRFGPASGVPAEHCATPRRPD
jgi:hypothetical protein